MTTLPARAQRTAQLVELAEQHGGLEAWTGALSSAEQLLAALRTRLNFERRVNHAPRRDRDHDAPETKRRRHAQGARLVPVERGM